MTIPPQPNGAGPERRADQRLPCPWRVFCRPRQGLAAMGWRGKVANVSPGGLGLLLRRSFPIDTALIAEVHDDRHGVGESFLVRVVHVERQPDDSWLVGCAFQDDPGDRLRRLHAHTPSET